MLPLFCGFIFVASVLTCFSMDECSCHLQTSVDSGNVANGIQLDRSITPVIPDLMDPTMCYLQNGYPYYYGGMFVPRMFGNFQLYDDILMLIDLGFAWH